MNEDYDGMVLRYNNLIERLQSFDINELLREEIG